MNVPTIMEKQPPIKFSIIVPTWNRPELLMGCLKAFEQLEYPRNGFEIIVVDDGSSVPLRPVVHHFSSKIPLRFFRQSNAGPAAARNLGAEKANEPYFVFTDDDCRPSSDLLLALSARFAESQNIAISGRRLTVFDNNIFSVASEAITEIACTHFNGDGERAQFVSTSNLAVPAKLFRDIGGFDESFKTAEDRDLGRRLRERDYTVHYAPEAIVYHAHSLTLATLLKRYFQIGKGARRYAHAKSVRGQSITRPDLLFYKKLIYSPISKRKDWAGALLSVLIALAQAANALGYLCETAKKPIANYQSL